MAANMAFTSFDPNEVDKLGVNHTDKRKKLFRKSQRDLLRECQKNNIETKGASNKADLVRLLLNTKPKKKKRKGLRSQSDALTLASQQRRAKMKIISSNQQQQQKDEIRFGNKYTLAGSSSIDSFNITTINGTTKKPKKKNKKRHPGRAQSDALSLKSIGVQAKKKYAEKKHNKHKNGNNNGYVSGLKMNSLIKLNGMQLNESYESNMKTENLFIEHMTLSQAQLLEVNDNIDFRSDNGYVFGATIIDKVGPELTVQFKNNMGQISKIKSNYNKEIYRFAKYLTISKRVSHRMLNLQVGNTVDVNPKCNGDDDDEKSEWMVGEIIQKDFKSGQCQIEYSYNNQKNLYWVHTDNVDEIAPYLTHYDMSMIMDTYLDPIRSDQEEENKNYHNWTFEDVINWLNTIENAKFEDDIKYKKIKDGIKEYNINYKALSNINDLTLKMLGIDDENDRKLIIREVNKINGTENKRKQRGMKWFIFYYVCCQTTHIDIL